MFVNMRALLILTLVVLVCVVSSTPIDQSRVLVNRPTADVIFRQARSPQVKEHNVYYVKGENPARTRKPLHLEVRKGEYICGDKVCKLTPGVIPKGCEEHICQYPIIPGQPPSRM